MSVGAALCHGSARIPNVPPAGTDPWEWFYDSPDDSVSLSGAALGHKTGIGGPRYTSGLTRWLSNGTARILLDRELSPRQRRDTLAHELFHVAIGGVCAMCPRNEARVEKATAMWLLSDLGRVRYVMQRANDHVPAAAMRLDVNTYVLEHRLKLEPVRPSSTIVG